MNAFRPILLTAIVAVGSTLAGCGANATEESASSEQDLGASYCFRCTKPAPKAPPPPPPAPTPHGRTPTFFLNGPAHYITGVAQGQGVTTVDHFCYLRAISGEFGGSDFITLDADPNGDWQSEIESDHSSSVEIECASLADFGASSDAQISMVEGFRTPDRSGTSAAALYPYLSSMCGLSRIQGTFDGAMNQAVIDIDWPNWELTTVNANANAMCVNLGAGVRSREYGNFSWGPGMPDVRMMPVASGICMLTKIQGSLHASDGVFIYEANGWYYLSGYQGGAANGEATCFEYAH